ncbi:MAG: YsnF/AvaK domain-containing protein [Candidatus Eremiobacteraeota bacterium]|nr:YsnF/AvaK domain-containing protein [Candidatus Eremiobacteraeota bacterium]
MDNRATIAALLDDRASAERIVPQLGRVGILREDIHVAMADRRELARFADQTSTSALPPDTADALKRVHIYPSLAEYFERGVADGKILILLSGVAYGAQAAQVLHEAQADFGVDISGAQLSGWSNPAQVYVPLRAEMVDVAKYLVQQGEVLLRKEVITDIARFEVPVVREELVIEQRGIEPASSPRITRIPLSHEEVRVLKRTVVTSEVSVRRERIEEVKQIEEPVRAEKLHVTKSGNVVMREA